MHERCREQERGMYSSGQKSFIGFHRITEPLHLLACRLYISVENQHPDSRIPHLVDGSDLVHMRSIPSNHVLGLRQVAQRLVYACNPFHTDKMYDVEGQLTVLSSSVFKMRYETI